jgi:type I restriction enzyme S subunit
MLDERQITKRFLAPYLRNTDVQWDGINVDDLPEMDFDESEQKLYGLRPGDILMCEGGEIGRCAIWDSDRRCFYQKALHRLRPTTDKDDPRYFVLVMRAAVEAGLFSSRASAATIQHLPAEKLRVVRYPAPPIEEQRDIVDCVSRQTARLDALVAAKQRLIDLLAEKRKAIIATAVTRGLDLKVKLRDSGVPWLYEIPAHWELKRAKWIFAERDQRSDRGEEVLLSLRMDRGLVPHNDVSPKQTRPEELIGYKRVSPGELVVNRMRASMGLIAVSPQEGLVSPDYAVFRVGLGVDVAYYDALFRTDLLGAVFRSESTGLGTGSSGFLRLYSESFLALWLPYPPADEQRAIIAHIARETAKLDAVRAATERTIALLKERRSALIAAAVTGQLDAGTLA